MGAVEQEFMANISEIESTKKTVSRCRRCEEVQREFRTFKEGAEEQRKVMNRDVKGLKKECTRFCESWMEAMKENMEMEAYIMAMATDSEEDDKIQKKTKTKKKDKEKTKKKGKNDNGVKYQQS